MTIGSEKLEIKHSGKARRGHVNVHKLVVVLFYVDWTMIMLTTYFTHLDTLTTYGILAVKEL